MLTKKNTLSTMYVLSNYGGGGKATFQEGFLLFFLFYNQSATIKNIIKMFPERDIRSVKRYVSNLEVDGMVTVGTHNGVKYASITERGTNYCIGWKERAELWFESHSTKKPDMPIAGE